MMHAALTALTPPLHCTADLCTGAALWAQPEAVSV